MKPKRRHLLVLAMSASGTALTSVVGGCGGESGEDDASAASEGTTSSSSGGGGGTFPQGYLDLGPVEALPVDSLVTVGAFELLVGRDADGVYAMTSRCTHKQCNMIGNDGIGPGNITVCGCHDSAFDPNGLPLNGPATEPLPHFDVIINEVAHIGVNPDITVDLDKRAAVPVG